MLFYVVQNINQRFWMHDFEVYWSASRALLAGERVALNLGTNKEFRAARGKQPGVTVDGRFVVFAIAPLKAEVDKAKKDKKKADEQPKGGLGVMDLAPGQVTTVDRVKSFKVPEESGAFVAYLLEPPVKKPDEKKDEAKKEPEAKPAAKPAEEKKEGTRGDFSR